jgi:xylan 1,4-beta-xylosidase
MYHAYERGYHTLGRQTLLEPIEWTSDGWFRVPDGVDPAAPIRKPAGKAVRHGLALSDDFADGGPGLQWRFYGGHRPGRCTVHNGALTMRAQGDSPADSSPMLCIPVDHAYEAQVAVKPADGATGGLVLFYNPHCFYALGACGGDVFLQNTRQQWGRASHSGSPVHLRIVNDHHEVTFSHGDGRRWTRMPYGCEVSGSHHNIFGGFLSLRVGLYAAGRGEVAFGAFRFRAL